MTYIKCLCFLFNYIIISKVLSSIYIIDKGILPLVKDSVAIQIFVDVENDDRKKVYKVYSKVKKCCLTDSDQEDCDVMDIYSETFNIVKPKDRNTFIHALPSIYQHDLIGYCEIALISRFRRTREKKKVQISFDTTTRRRKHSLSKGYISKDKSMSCKTLDQNSLDKCSPANCDLKYFAQRPFYDVNINRCIAAPVCLGGRQKDLPDIVYDPNINVCKDLSLPLSFRDIHSMSTGIGTVLATKKPDKVKVRLKPNCTTISQNLLFIKDLMYGEMCVCGSNDEINYKDGCKSAVFSILIYIVSVCFLLFSFVCCIYTSVWVHRQWLKGNIKKVMKKVRSKFKRTKKVSRRHRNIGKARNSLLREVVVNDIPLELRDSIVSICERMEKDIYKKNRYRKSDIGSQISLQKNRTMSRSTNSLSDGKESEREPLVK